MGRPYCLSLLQALVVLICVATCVKTKAPNAYYFCDDSESNVIQINKSSPPIVIRSPYAGTDINDNPRFCSVVIRSMDEPLILNLDYNSFNVTSSELCSVDFLCVHGVKFCGDWLANEIYKYVLPGNSNFTFAFTSTTLFNLSGIEIIVTAELAINQTIEEVTGGIGSQNTSLITTTVTYQPGLSYTDKCVNPQRPTSDATSSPIVSTVAPSTDLPTEAVYFCNVLQSSIVNISSSRRPFVIRSPNYDGGYYPSNQHCYVAMKSDHEALIVSLQYSKFTVELTDGCKFDFLCVHGVKFCGSWIAGKTYTYILPENSYLTLVFSSDWSMNNEGFEIKVTAKPAINQTIEEIIGGQGSGQDKIITARVSYQPGFPYTDKCGFPHRASIVHTRSSAAPTTAPATNMAETIHFCEESSSNRVNINSSTLPLVFHSPRERWIFNPPDNRCPIVIQSGDEALLLSVHFSKFDVSWHESCSRTSLCVHGVKFCGSWPTGEIYRYILPENRTFTLVATLKDFPDFEILVTAELAINQTIEEVTGGIGSQNTSLIATNVTYQPGLPYTDKCVNPQRPTSGTTSPSIVSTDAPSTDLAETLYFCDVSRSNIVNINSSTHPLVFRSPSERWTDYNLVHHCSIVIQSGDEALLLSVHFGKFYTSENEVCSLGNLCVHGVQFCGSWPTGEIYRYILPENSSFTLVARTRDMPEYMINVTASKLDINEKIDVAVGGLGSSKSSIHIHQVTYSEYRYRDACTRGVYTFCGQSQFQTIDISASSLDALLQSHDLLESYGTELNCSLTLRSGNEPLILSLTFNFIEVEHDPTCSGDFLCVHGVNFCGQWLQDRTLQYILPENSSFTLLFNTDGSYNGGRGFQIIATAEPAINQTIEEVTGGVGSKNCSLITTTVTYQPGLPYTDRCVDPQRPTSDTTSPSIVSSDAPCTDLVETLYFCDVSRSNIVNINSSTHPLVFRSPNEMSTICSIVIQSGDEALLLSVHFGTFDTLEYEICNLENLCVHGVTFCGSWPTGEIYRYILPENSNFTLVSTLQRQRAFEINVTASKLDINDKINVAVGGLGSSKSSIRIHPVTYSEYRYRDACTRSVYTLCGESESKTIDISASSLDALLQSHDLIENYNPGLKCSLTLRSGNEPLILSLTFNLIDVDYDPTCSGDFLCVHGVNFCAQWLQDRTLQYILPENSSFTLLFKSDHSYNGGMGFQIIATAEPAINQTIEEVTGGIGSKNCSLITTTVTYQPGLPYTDRCVDPQRPTSDTTSPSIVSTNAPCTDLVETLYFCDVSRSNIVNINSSTHPLVFRSPSERWTDYNLVHHCSIVIQSGDEALLLSVHFGKFETSGFDRWCRDYLCLNGVKFCGSWPTGETYRYILPKNSNFTLVARTGDTPDYVMNVTASKLDINQKIDVAVAGFGISKSGIRIEPVTYPEFVYRDACTRSVYSLCGRPEFQTIDINASSLDALLESHNVYADGTNVIQNCSLTLRSGNEPLILSLKFNFIYGDHHPSCSSDFLCVHGIHFCGQWLTDRTFQYILPENSSFTLLFNSDRSYKEGLGYQIQILMSQKRASNETIQEATGGVGSDLDSLSFTPTSYSPGYRYWDRCVQPAPTTPAPTTPAPTTPAPTTPATPQETSPTATGTLHPDTGPVNNHNVNEVEAAIENAIYQLNRALAMLRQKN